MIKKVLIRYRHRIVLLSLFSIFAGLLSIVPMIFMQKILDVSLSTGENLVRYGLAYISAILIHFLLRLILKNFGDRVDNAINFSIRNDLFSRILGVDLYELEQLGKNDLFNIIVDDTKEMSGKVISLVTDFAYSISSFVLALIIMMSYDIFTVLVVVPLALCSTLLLKRGYGRISCLASESQRLTTNVWGLFGDGIRGSRDILLFNRINAFRARFEATNGDLLKKEDSLSKVQNLSSALAGIFFMLIIAFILLFGGIGVSTGRISVGGLVAILMYNHMLTDPVFELVNKQKQFGKIYNAYSRVTSYLKKLSSNNYLENYADFQTLRLQNISIKFNSNIILENFYFDINRGDQILIRGHTGCGKSSLAKIITGAYKPATGNITINNLVASDLKLRFSCLFQDNILFRGNIIENITFPNPQISGTKLEEILKITRANEIVDRYGENNIGEGGVNLSGGERKRILLARALTHDADIYIFDEPSTGLDLKLFYDILDDIFHYLAGKTIIVIEHLELSKSKFNKIVDFDKVIKLKRG